MQLRIATYNVENLFGRAKILNFEKHDDGDAIMKKAADLQQILEQEDYSAQDKRAAAEIYEEIKDYIDINILRSSIGFHLFKRSGSTYRLVPDGRDDWLGFITFQRDSFSDDTSRNTAKVIQELDADILCINEVENRTVLDQFNSGRLHGMYEYNILIDCKNDPRGIDVGIYSKFPIGHIRTNIFTKNSSGRNLFSRDCLEVEVLTPEGPVHVLANHFKSKSGGGNQRRRGQAEEVKRILTERYDLRKDKVAVLGDLNDTPQSWPLQPLTQHSDLSDVLHSSAGPAAGRRWTYNYRGQLNQIDFILASKPLYRKLVSAGVERRGMSPDDLAGTNAGVSSFHGIKNWRDAASDHGAVYADFDI